MPDPTMGPDTAPDQFQESVPYSTTYTTQRVVGANIFSLVIVADFTPAQANLTNVGYTIYNTDNSINLSRTSYNVYETPSGSGIYSALIQFQYNFQGWIVWDTGNGSATYKTYPINFAVDPPWNQDIAITQILSNTQPSALQTIILNALSTIDVTKFNIDKILAYAADAIHYDDILGIVTIYDPTGNIVITQFQNTYNANGHLIARNVLQ